MTPLAEILTLLRATSARSFSERHPDQDLVLLEPYEKGRGYDYASPVHPGATARFLPRAVNQPVPVGRDSRSLVLLDHPAVSRLHAVIAYTPGGWKVMDRSSNGSWLGDDRLPKDQAVDLPFGAYVRLGRALVMRLFPPEEFHRYVSDASAAKGAAAPAPPTADRVADTWRIPASYLQGLPGREAAAPPPESTLEIDFQFEGPPKNEPATVRLRRDPRVPPDLPPAMPHVPAMPSVPAVPSVPAAPERVSDGDIDYEFDFDFEGDGRGGF